MQADAGWCRLMQADAGWCRLMQADAGWCKPAYICCVLHPIFDVFDVYSDQPPFNYLTNSSSTHFNCQSDPSPHHYLIRWHWIWVQYFQEVLAYIAECMICCHTCHLPNVFHEKTGDAHRWHNVLCYHFPWVSFDEAFPFYGISWHGN
jgi:hypothetical protein